MNAEQLLKKYQEPHYLGDGLFVTFDGYQYRLFTDQDNEVYLEPDVIHSFAKYQKELNDEIAKISS